MHLVLINHTFSLANGQGCVNSRISQAMLAGGHRVDLIGREIPSEISKHRQVRSRSLSSFQWLPTRFVKHFVFGYLTAREIRRLRALTDLIVVNGGMTFAQSDVSLCHFVHASWAKSAHHPKHTTTGFQRLWGAYQAAYTQQAIWWERDAYRRAGHVVAVSELVRQQLIDDVGIEPSKVTTIENGLDPLPEIDRRDARRRLREPLGINDDVFVVFFAGELRTPRKNLDVLLRAIKRLPKDVVLVAAGGADGGPYPQRVQALGLADRVHFLGHRSDVRSLYAGADLFAFLSHYDPFALVVTEAMAAGLPVITSSMVGASAAVQRYGCGVVLDDQEDDEAVAASITRLKNDVSLREQYSSAAQSAVAELAWPVVGRRYAELFESIAAAK